MHIRCRKQSKAGQQLSKMASRDPSKWMQWYIELQSIEEEQGEEVLGEADSDEDDGDFTTRSDHGSESEQEAEEPEDGDNSEWFRTVVFLVT
ncbi:unnamed protein product [Callosobruchus maculatus]|uniref:Uncharacterized protein n=1 Tax=Callosobruchus maculatus TaxID=64391 RepID=A0A653D2B4_CALMS|nr:unnamed protein product [Callosobruchus maculatus]